jgi:uncharacterized protein YciI
MLFALYCVDKAGAGQVRLDNRAAHLQHLQAHMAQIRFAGPLTSDDGAAMQGSLLLMDFPDRAAAEEFAQGDPYAKAGLFAEVRIAAVKQVLPKA